MPKKRILVICVDRDNDLYKKANVSGPVIGREANIKAATDLLLADPEDVDGNTMFEAVKIYDSLSAEYDAQVVTLTGDERLSYHADREISDQLDTVLSEFPVDSCILVSDGEMDEEIMPIIQSRMKIDSVKRVVVRQAKELEKTYFVILEKLKEPYYAHILLGLPAVLLISYTISEWLGYGWPPIAIVVGAYLLLRAYGAWDKIERFFKGFRISVENVSFIGYVIAIPFIVASLMFALNAYGQAVETGVSPLELAAAVLRSFLGMFPWAVIMILVSKIMDLLHERKKYEVIRYCLYMIIVIVLWLIFLVATDWILRDAYFKDFVITIILSVILVFISVEVAKKIRKDMITRIDLVGKTVITELGVRMGKVVGIDKIGGGIIIQTPFGQKLKLDYDSVISISDNVIVKY
ncbi:MAG: DUF373 family protein [Candidatus Micrarchaeia archaeon]